MFSEILKIIPKLEPGDLRQMEQSLASRFGNVAKKFGKGLTTALAGGGIMGLAAGLIDKLLNPLKETQEAIDKTLKQSDDLVTNAKQFGTTAGKLFKLSQIGKSTGLDEGSLYMLIQKFQSSIAEAKADPEKQTSVRQFVNMPDTAEAFFNFIQSLQKMTKDQQLLVQQEVFGEKQILKMADFLQTDMPKQLGELHAAPSEMYTRQINKLGDLNDRADLLEARRNLNDMLAKGQKINEEMVNLRDRALQVELSKENERIATYKSLAVTEAKVTQVVSILEKGYMDILDIAVNARTLSGVMQKLTNSRALRGILGLVGDK